jgi:hypothetical protein
MKAHQLLHMLISSDVRIWAEGEKLKWDAPKGVVTDKIKAQMKEKKYELILMLRSNRRNEQLELKGKDKTEPATESQLKKIDVVQIQDTVKSFSDNYSGPPGTIAHIEVPAEGDLIIDMFPENGDPNCFRSYKVPLVKKSDDYDESQGGEINKATTKHQSRLILPERYRDVSPHSNKIILGDCFDIIKSLEGVNIDLCLTSPPYSNTKSYGKNVEIFHPDEYVDWILPLLVEIYRKLTLTGSFILDINDRIEKKQRHPFVHELIVRAVKETQLKYYDIYFWCKKNFLPNGGQKRLNHITEYLIHFCKDERKVK